MINIETISSNILRITVAKKLHGGDFKEIAPLVDALIAQHRTIRVLIDASDFEGWENITAFEEHINFLKNHQKKVERIAVITGAEWQHWLIGTFKLFVHPQITGFNKGQESAALNWLSQ